MRRVALGISVMLTAMFVLTAAVPANALVGQEVALGSVIGTDGEPSAGADVALAVEPTPDQLRAMPVGRIWQPTVLTTTVSDAEGAFSLRLASSTALRAWAAPSGLVNLVVIATDQGGVTAAYRTRVLLTSGGSVSAHEPDILADTAPDYRASLVAQGRAAGQSRLTGTRSGRPIVAMFLGQPAAAAPVVAQPAASGPVATVGPSKQYDPSVLYCSGNPYGYRKTNSRVRRYVTLMRQAHYSRTNGRFTYETTREQSDEIAVTSTAGAFSVSAGFTETATSGASISIPSNPSTTPAWEVDMYFRAHDIMCLASCGVICSRWVYSGYREWRPEGFTGAARVGRWSRFACNRDRFSRNVPAGATITVADGKSSTSTHAFTFGSGKMRAQQSWARARSTTTSATVQYTGLGRNPYTICGYGGTWNEGVARTQEVVYRP
jgi:hypothetical protein